MFQRLTVAAILASLVACVGPQGSPTPAPSPNPVPTPATSDTNPSPKPPQPPNPTATPGPSSTPAPAPAPPPVTSVPAPPVTTSTPPPAPAKDCTGIPPKQVSSPLVGTIWVDCNGKPTKPPAASTPPPAPVSILVTQGSIDAHQKYPSAFDGRPAECHNGSQPVPCTANRMIQVWAVPLSGGGFGFFSSQYLTSGIPGVSSESVFSQHCSATRDIGGIRWACDPAGTSEAAAIRANSTALPAGAAAPLAKWLAKPVGKLHLSDFLSDPCEVKVCGK